MNSKQGKQEFSIDTNKQGEAHVVTIRGSLADESNLLAKESFLKLLDEKPNRIVVDLEATEYISSSGIGLLVSVLRRCRQRGISMPVCHLKPELLDLFRLTRLNQVFEIFDDLASALQRK